MDNNMPVTGYQRTVSFAEAVSRAFKNYVCSTGRASRSEYWYFYLFTFLVGLVLSFFDLWIGNDVLSYLASIAFFLPGLGVACRRMHDIGKGAGWIFITLIPVVGWIIFIVFCCQPSEMSPNRFGPIPNWVD